MPTISQLPAAGEVGAADQIPISQGGSAHALSVGSLLASVQPAILVPTGAMLGRTSLGPGGPEPVSLGLGLAINTGTLLANGTDHTTFAAQETLSLGDEAVLNSSGVPKVMALSLLRGLYSAGTNIVIDENGTISAANVAPDFNISTLPSVSTIAEDDLVAISHNGADHTVAYADLIDGQTVDEIQTAGAASDGDWLLVGQGGTSLLRQDLAAIWTWLNTKMPSYLLPTLELTSNTALATPLHNGRILLCSQPVTITAASSDLGNGFSCVIINISGGNVVLGSNIATSSGISLLNAGQTATLSCITYSGGNLVFASIGLPASSASPPAQVAGLTATATTSGSVVLNWTALGLAPTSYVVQYRVTGSGPWTSAPSVVSSSCTIAGLLAGTSYDFVASAVNGAGAGVPSAIVTAVTLAGLALPGPVTSLVASDATAATISLSWTAPTSGGAVASYMLQYRVTGSTQWSNLASGVTTTSYSASGLAPSTSYEFQVFAVNETGAGPMSTMLTASTTASGSSVTAITWNVGPSGSYAHAAGTIALNAHITPATASVQFAFSTSGTTPPTSWTLGNYVNSDLWGAYVDTPTAAGIYYAWVEGTDGSLPTVYPSSFTVS